MKTPRIADFDPNATPPSLGSPLDNMPAIQKPSKPKDSEVSPTPPSVQAPVPMTKAKEKPEIMKSRKPERASPAVNGYEIPEKYSTLLRPSLKKKIKLHAVELGPSLRKVSPAAR